MSLEKIKGDGAARELTDKEFSEMRGDVVNIRRAVETYVIQRRLTLENALYCRWEGQSDSGRKERDALGYDPKPFDKASDNRVRLADQIVQEHVLEKVTAATRATPRAVGMEGNDESEAGKVSSLVRWLVRNQWGQTYRKNLKLLARWSESDHPAACVCWVDWVTERALEVRRIDAQGLVDWAIEAAAANGTQIAEEDATRIIDLATDPMQIEELQKLMGTLAPQLSDGRIAKAAKELQDKGTTDLPVPYIRKEIPVMQPLRLFEDVFFDPNVTDLQRARRVYVREWYTAAEIREKAGTEGWPRGFVDALLGTEDGGKGKEALSAWDVLNDTRVVRPTGETHLRRDLYEINRCFRRAVNDDGVMGIYVTTFSAFVETEAKTELWARKHGKYPLVYFPRESLTNRIMDSRSVAELTLTDQMTRKLLKDSFEDHVQVATLPPIKHPMGLRYKIKYEPMGMVQAGPREDVKFMDPPTYPSAARDYWDRSKADVDEYWGRPTETTAPALAQMHAQDRVDTFLASLSEVLTMAVQLCQEFMPDARIQRIVGGDGMPVARSRAEIQGMYDIILSYDVKDLDQEYLLKKFKMLVEYVKTLDTRATVQWDRIVNRAMQSIDANWAEESVVPVASADQREVREEQAAFVAMLTGVRPEMPEGGINAELRLQTLQEQLAPRQANPAAYPPISAASHALIKERAEYLTFQAQQQQNAVTGRIGVDTGKTDKMIAEGGTRNAEGMQGNAESEGGSGVVGRWGEMMVGGMGQ